MLFRAIYINYFPHRASLYLQLNLTKFSILHGFFKSVGDLAKVLLDPIIGNLLIYIIYLIFPVNLEAGG